MNSLQNKIWNLPDRSTILPKFIYDKEGKLAGPTQILPVNVRGPALILKTAWNVIDFAIFGGWPFFGEKNGCHQKLLALGTHSKIDHYNPNASSFSQ